jgi:hypothetical protein
MAQGNIGLRFNIDVSQAKPQVEDLSKTVAGLNEQIREATEKKDWDSVVNLSKALESTLSSRNQIMQQAKQSEAANQKDSFLGGGGQGWWMFQTALNRITDGIIKSMDAALSAAKQRASGDYTGAEVTERRAHGEIAGQGVGMAVGALGFLGGPLLGMLTTQIGGEIGRFIGGIDSKKLEERLAFSQQYKSVFPSLDSLNQYFGGAVNRNTATENNKQALTMYGHARSAAAGTGLTTQAFVEAMKQTGAYGVRSETQALNMAKNQALWSRFTGADLSSIQKFAGQAYRFGGDTGAVSKAYGGLMAQNMGKGQFSEFLNSMERILEEGIAKGFVRSSSEIAGNMAMLYKLSGNSSLWQGEQGAQRLSQMNSAVANATNLQSVEDVVSFGVARKIWDEHDKTGWKPGEQRAGITYTGTYADEMQLLERGVSPDLLQGQFKAVRGLEGGNVAGMIERFKTMYGLSYHGGAQVWAMMDNAFDSEGNWKPGYTSESLAREIERMQTVPKLASDSQLLQDSLNKLNNTLVNIGSMNFEEELDILRMTQGDVGRILAEMTRDARLAANGGVVSTASSDQRATQADLDRIREDNGPNRDRMAGIMAAISIEGGTTRPNGSRQTNSVAALSRLSAFSSERLNAYGQPGSDGGSEVTDREYQQFIRDLQTLINNINNGRERNAGGERMTDVHIDLNLYDFE